MESSRHRPESSTSRTEDSYLIENLVLSKQLKHAARLIAAREAHHAERDFSSLSGFDAHLSLTRSLGGRFLRLNHAKALRMELKEKGTFSSTVSKSFTEALMPSVQYGERLRAGINNVTSVKHGYT